MLTGKGISWGGSLIRPEATGFGVVYFAQEMLKTRDTDFEGKTVVVSGFRLNDNAADLALYRDGVFSQPALMEFFVQWGSSGNGG